jgi:N4-gp56 family major capsid protein
MSQTVIAWGDPKAAKKWSANLAVDTLEKGYFDNKFVGKGSNNIIEHKPDLESEAGDRVSFDLSVQLRKAPTTGDQRVKGNGENLRFFTDEVIIDQARHEVSAGGRMTRKRTVHNLRQIARDRMGDYWAKWKDELMFMYLAGARGVNEDFIEDTDYTGHAGNAFTAPDSQHILYGGDAVSKASIVAADKMDRSIIERAVTTARMMRARDPSTANMVPVKIGSMEHYVTVMSPYQEHDLRNESGSEWLDIQKAAAAAEGSKNKIFTGGLGMINNVVLHSHSSVIRFSDYGAGSNVEAARALFMGRQAAVYAAGVKNGRFEWSEEMEDRGNEPVVTAGTIIGIKKTTFNGKDFGVMALDTAATAPTG